MSKISAVIITLNEEKNIARCIRSLKDVADEILIIDSFSTDQTVVISQNTGATVLQKEWLGYGETKNYGNSMAKYDYILSLDADEALSPQLAQSVLNVKENLSGAYSFNRLTNYCGQWIHHCGWYPDKKIRLFNRKNAQWSNHPVHESLELNPRLLVTHLRGDLFHYSFATIAEHLKRVNKYSELAAKELIAGEVKISYLKLVSAPAIKFISSYFIKRGFADGFYGYCICAISAFDLFIRYAKVIQMRRTVES